MKRSQSQSGNVFFILFLAVAMFGALSYAVMRGGRTSGAMLTADQAKLGAQEIVAIGNSIAASVQKLRLRGCTDTQFSFANNIWVKGDGSTQIPPTQNPSAVAGCSIFSSEDGKAVAQIYSTAYTSGNAPITPTSTGLGSARILRLSMPSIGNNIQDDIVYGTFRLEKTVCMRINNILGVTNPSDSPPVFDWTGPVDYTGTFANVAITDTSGVLSGKAAFCGKNTSLNFNVFVQTLLTR